MNVQQSHKSTKCGVGKKPNTTHNWRWGMNKQTNMAHFIICIKNRFIHPVPCFSSNMYWWKRMVQINVLIMWECNLCGWCKWFFCGDRVTGHLVQRWACVTRAGCDSLLMGLRFLLRNKLICCSETVSFYFADIFSSVWEQTLPWYWWGCCTVGFAREWRTISWFEAVTRVTQVAQLLHCRRSRHFGASKHTLHLWFWFKGNAAAPTSKFVSEHRF